MSYYELLLFMMKEFPVQDKQGRMGDSAYSFSLTTFSPTGKLLQIEHALNAVNKRGKTSLGIRAVNGVVLATNRKVPALVDPSSFSKISKVTDSVGVVYSGLGPDSRVLLKRARKQAQAYYRQYLDPIPTVSAGVECWAVGGRVCGRAGVCDALAQARGRRLRACSGSAWLGSACFGLRRLGSDRLGLDRLGLDSLRRRALAAPLRAALGRIGPLQPAWARLGPMRCGAVRCGAAARQPRLAKPPTLPASRKY
jgi:hypothetical protein